jgi:arylsulfatase A-like enzyme
MIKPEGREMKKYKSAGINRREFVSSAVAATALSSMPWGRLSAPPPRPNILFILADDLGYGDLSCYGRPDYRTPHLDRLAEQGVRLTNAYAAAPVCTPTRCAFITGRYPARTPVGLEEPLTWRKNIGDRLGLSPDHPTIASLLKGNGYETALVGKWHLGYPSKFGPIQSGFEHFFGIMSGGVDYFTHKDGAGEPDLYENQVPVERVGYITELLTERAVQFISQRRDRPFYLSLHYTAPHWPWEGPGDEQVSKTLRSLTEGGSLKAYASMMKSLDDGIGRVLKALSDAKLDRDTLVIFTSDNGGERFSYHWPFTGQKLNLREGGVRVPAIVRWPGVLPSERVHEQTAVTMDWTATILAVTQTKPDTNYPLDGEDLLTVLRGQRPAYERTIFWRIRNQGAARSGKWKYLKQGNDEFLFDLTVDQREQADFKEKNTEVLQRIRTEYQRWESQMLPLPERRASGEE